MVSQLRGKKSEPLLGPDKLDPSLPHGTRRNTIEPNQIQCRNRIARRGRSVKHIGIVGCSAEGAALCYRTICLEAEALLGKHAHPEISLHTIALAEYMGPICSGNWQGVADLMLQSARKLHRAGADFLICPDNTIH